MIRRSHLVIAALTTLAFAGCTRDRGDAKNVQPAPTAPAAMTPPAATAPTAAPAATPPGGHAPRGTISGKVTETMDAGGYTYAKIEGDAAPVWVAGPQTPITVGTAVAGVEGQLMSGFHSNTLNRTFDEIYFIGSFEAGGKPPSPHGGQDMSGQAMGGTIGGTDGAGAPGESMGGAPAPGPNAVIEKIAAAPGGQTVAEVFAKKDALAGKPVVVRGKVIKVNNGILGRNWMHLQDGTGAAGTNDLLVTSTATANIGDVIVARGTIALNKDFGAGYTYAVIVEDAALGAK